MTAVTFELVNELFKNRSLCSALGKLLGPDLTNQTNVYSLYKMTTEEM